MDCLRCRSPLPPGAPFCTNCGATAGTSPGSYHAFYGQHSVGIAVILQILLSGLGQLYNRQWQKAILFWVIFLIALCSGIGIIIIPFLWIYGIVDAIRIASKLAHGQVIEAWTF